MSDKRLVSVHAMLTGYIIQRYSLLFSLPRLPLHTVARSVVEDSLLDSFVFRISECQSIFQDSLLVDCGATAHILNKKSKFTSFEQNFPDTAGRAYSTPQTRSWIWGSGKGGEGKG